MLFKNPNILYALFALLIPIIVHLFQLRRFKKVAFTNVAMLKQLELQTRKSAKLKKWLILLTRLGFFTMLILAFAKPYFPSKNKANDAPQETLVFLDNSFSMQGSGVSGVLLANSKQQILETLKEETTLGIMTNDESYEKQKGATLKKTIQNVTYSAKSFDINTTLLQANQQLLKHQDAVKNMIVISDFQNLKEDSITTLNPAINYYFIPKKIEKRQNQSIEKLQIKNKDQNSYELEAFVKNQSDEQQNKTIAVYGNKKLLAKNTLIVPAKSSKNAHFTIQKQDAINGYVSLEDNGLQFDNRYFFSLKTKAKINVLLIGKNSDYLKHIYTQDEFNTTQVDYNAVDYTSFSKQDLIVLNALEQLNAVMFNNLKTFAKQGGTVLIIPNKSLVIDRNTNYFTGKITPRNDSLYIQKINYSHPILKNVFIKKIQNFDYPYSTKQYLTNAKNAILYYADGSSFISSKMIGKGNCYFVASALDKSSSNFKNSPLIVPIFYNIATYNSQTTNQDFIIGKTNSFSVETTLKKDAVLTLHKDEFSFIPQQQIGTSKVLIKTHEKPKEAGIYTIKNANKTAAYLAYNYDRAENTASYVDINKLENNKNVTISPNFATSFKTIQAANSIKALWKWFLGLAILFIILEMLIIKFLK